MKKEEKIRKNRDFIRVYKRGKSFSNYVLVLYIYKNKQNVDLNRIGISVSKKVGNSVVRSRVKRLISEAYRINKDCLIEGYDLVFIARNSSKEKSFKEIESSVLKLLKKAGLYN
ncbi:ribonuclease P protein component [Clostridium sediminicola]|uniref:ribonuclease P protein component n=1 Tax=Clostridium sediminicola TaxID=3114879 RepID=UPI0031F248A9